MTLRKFNEQKREYEPYEVPDDWHIRLCENNMNEVINCAGCGKMVTFGESFSSHQIHSKSGLGYAVCPECHEKEWDEYRNARKNDD